MTKQWLLRQIALCEESIARIDEELERDNAGYPLTNAHNKPLFRRLEAMGNILFSHTVTLNATEWGTDDV